MRRGYYKILAIVNDFLSAVTAWVVFYLLRKNILGEGLFIDYAQLVKGVLVISCFWMVLFAAAGFYQNVFKKSRVKLLFALFVISLIGSIVIFMTFMLDDDVNHHKDYYRLFYTYFLVHFSIVGFQKILTLSYFRKLIRLKKIFFNTLIIGSNNKAKEIFNDL